MATFRIHQQVNITVVTDFSLPYGAVVVSVQAQTGEPFAEPACKQAMMNSVMAGGAQGLRLAGVDDIASARNQWPDCPIIGITKPDPLPENWREIAYITPTLADMQAIADAGASIVATDGTPLATNRPRPDGLTLADTLTQFKASHPNTAVMADVDSLENALAATQAGAHAVATTLAGYTMETVSKTLDTANTPLGPDWGLLYQLTQHCTAPVILEGRIWAPADVTKAFRLGAHAVVIGSAITRPWEITRRFLAQSAL